MSAYFRVVDPEDVWKRGKDLNGNYSVSLMKENYPHITLHSWAKMIDFRKMLEAHLPPKTDGLRPYRTMGSSIFFENEDDYTFVKSLRYLY